MQLTPLTLIALGLALDGATAIMSINGSGVSSGSAKRSQSSTMTVWRSTETHDASSSSQSNAAANGNPSLSDFPRNGPNTRDSSRAPGSANMKSAATPEVSISSSQSIRKIASYPSNPASPLASESVVSNKPIPSNIGVSVIVMTTADSAGETTTYTTDDYFYSAYTIVTTDSGGEQITVTSTAVDLPLVTLTTTDSRGLTTTIESPELSLPGLTLTTTDSAGLPTTIASDGTVLPLITSAPSSTSSSSSDPVGFLIPITTAVDKPKASKDGKSATIPCKLWFFTICLRLEDINIQGWEFHFPGPVEGWHLPGPMPPIRIGPPPPPGLEGLKIDLKGPKLTWPKYSVGPDNVPTFSQEPDEGCQTQTATMCATRTSYGVSLTETTASKVVSTCASIYGCEVQDVSTSATVTRGCTKATTVTDLWVSCPVSATDSASCKTTSTSAVTGCSVEPTTFTCGALPTGGIGRRCAPPPAQYEFYIYPTDGRNAKQVDAIEDQVRAFVRPEVLPEIKASRTRLSGLSYWRVVLTADESDHVRTLPDVAAVYLGTPFDPTTDDASGTEFDPTTEVVYQGTAQDPAPDHLVSISWPPSCFAQLGTNTPDMDLLRPHYYFDQSAGAGVRVYVVDSGATFDHPEFDNLRDRQRWIHVNEDTFPPGLHNTQPNDDSQEDITRSLPKEVYRSRKTHGTSMLGLVGGQTLGVAKAIDPVIVRLPRRAGSGAFNMHDFLDGLEMVNDELGAHDNSLAGSVMLMSIYYPQEYFLRKKPSTRDLFTGPDGKTVDDSQAWVDRVHDCLQDLERKGVILVTGSGNAPVDATDDVIDGWPASFGKSNSDQRIDSMIVVGAISADGTQTAGKYSVNGDLPHLRAPGIHVAVPEGAHILWDERMYKTSGGTSDAAALTAGLAAYYLSLARQNELYGFSISNGNSLSLVQDTPAGIKQHILDTSWERTSQGEEPRKAIWNQIDCQMIVQPGGICEWNPVVPLQRRQESCKAPLTTGPSRATVSTSSISMSSNAASSTLKSVISVPASFTTSIIQSPSSSTPLLTSLISDPPPLQTQAPICRSEADLPGHADIHESAVISNSYAFCTTIIYDKELFPDEQIGAGGHYDKTYKTQGVHYHYFISWAEGCTNSNGTQDVTFPIGGTTDSCDQILTDTFRKCTGNGGVGGSIQAGCVIYQFIGGEGST